MQECVTMFLANFSSGDAQRPSFFEMVAQNDLLPFFAGPALKYTLSVRRYLSP